MSTDLVDADGGPTARTAGDTRRALGRALRAEAGKAFTVWAPGLWLVAAGLVLGATASSLANDFVHAITIGEVPPGSRMPAGNAFGPSLTAASVVIAAFGVQLVGPEYASGSVVSTFLAQPRRGIVLGAKALLAALSALVVGVVLGPRVAVTIDALLGDAAGRPVPPGVAAVAAGVVLVDAAVLGVAVTFVLRSAVGALCTCFVLLAVTLAAPEPSGRWLPGAAAARWVEDLAAGRPGVEGALVATAWSLLAAGLAAWSLRHRDALR